MHLFTRLHQQILNSIMATAASEEWLIDQRLFDRITTEPPRNEGHGDVTTNAAMILSKSLGVAPMMIAEPIAATLRQDHPDFTTVEVAKPGFINISLNASFWHHYLGDICAANVHFGRLKSEHPRVINVEYVSANPTGPLHIGHTRGAVYGDVLARLLHHAGHDVTKEYYVNDAGVQIDVLANSLYWRYRELCGDVKGDMPDGYYPGEYLIPVAQKIYDQYDDSLLSHEEYNRHEILKKEALEAMLYLIKDDLRALGVDQDVFTHEQDIITKGLVKDMCDDFLKHDLLYYGELDPPKGKIPDDWEARTQLLFRSGDYGDDTDRPLQKSDGSWTYFASDIAYHFDKYQRGYREMINVFGADHAGYVKRLVASVKAFSQNQASLDIKVCQLVRFMDDGTPVKMSKRAGQFITMRDLVDKVGADAVRVMMLTRKNDAQMDFDFAKTLEQSKDNPVFYLQYAHARCCSLESLAGEAFDGFGELDEQWKEADLTLLTHEAELRLIMRLADWPRQVELAANAYEPHRIIYYLMDMAADFHALWNIGSGDASLRFIHKESVPHTRARMALVYAVQSVLVNGFEIIGITPVRQL